MSQILKILHSTCSMYRLYLYQAGYKTRYIPQESLSEAEEVPRQDKTRQDKSCKVCRRHPEIKASKLQLGTAKIAATIVIKWLARIKTKALKLGKTSFPNLAKHERWLVCTIANYLA